MAPTKRTSKFKNMNYSDLGKAKIRQTSITTEQENINAKIEQKFIEGLLLKNINLIEKLFIDVKDELYEDFIDCLKKKKN